MNEARSLRKSNIPRHPRWLRWLHRWFGPEVMPWRGWYNPPDCNPNVVRPLPDFERLDGEDKSLLRAMYESSLNLVVHDDTLNWQKFHNMAYVNVGLLAGYALAIAYIKDYELLKSVFLCCTSMFGVICNIGFDLTLQEGMRCLRSHRLKVELLENTFTRNESRTFLFCGNPYNRREALHWGPYVGVLLWSLLTVLSVAAAILAQFALPSHRASPTATARAANVALRPQSASSTANTSAISATAPQSAVGETSAAAESDTTIAPSSEVGEPAVEAGRKVDVDVPVH